MKGQLDRFSKEALEAEAVRCGCTPGAILRSAADHYLADRDAGRVAWPVPQLMRGCEGSRGLEVELDAHTRDALSAEADRQGVSVECLAEHALLYYLARA